MSDPREWEQVPCGSQKGHAAHHWRKVEDGPEFRCHGAFDAGFFASRLVVDIQLNAWSRHVLYVPLGHVKIVDAPDGGLLWEITPVLKTEEG
jgi:hypothetical protein